MTKSWDRGSHQVSLSFEHTGVPLFMLPYIQDPLTEGLYYVIWGSLFLALPTGNSSSFFGFIVRI